MNIVLTNDDGYHAPGILAAYRALEPLGHVQVIAPRTERSACSHTITLSHPITVELIEHGELGLVHAVDGTPADCIRLAVMALMEDPIDLVVSGINAGANSGVDVYYSGTVAGAREAAFFGIRSIAVSQGLKRGTDIDWDAAREVTGMIVQDLLEEPLPGRGFWSVNLPPCIPSDPRDHMHRVPVSMDPSTMNFQRSERDDGRVLVFDYDAAYWTRQANGRSDYSVIREGGIAITAIPIPGEFLAAETPPVRNHHPARRPQDVAQPDKVDASG